MQPTGRADAEHRVLGLAESSGLRKPKLSNLFDFPARCFTGVIVSIEALVALALHPTEQHARSARSLVSIPTLIEFARSR